MSHFEERLENDLNEIRRLIQTTGEHVEQAIEHSVRAILTGDHDLAYQTILKDQIVNREIKRLDWLCHAFVARHLPSAGHLRFVSSVLRINVALERIGDYAVTICRETVRIAKPLPETITRDLDMLVDESHVTLRQSLQAFDEMNADLARGTGEMASHLGRMFDKVFADLVEVGEKQERSVRDLFSLLVIFNRLSRVCDQAKNICEETIFVATGESAQKKPYRILFIDRLNRCQSQMAAAIGRKAFSRNAQFFSMGWEPADSVSDSFVEFMEQNGHPVRGLKTQKLSPRPEFLNDYQVIVCLEGNACDRLPTIPYHLVVLNWDVPSEPVDGTSPETMETYEAMYRELASRLGSLMETLTGE